MQQINNKEFEETYGLRRSGSGYFILTYGGGHGCSPHELIGLMVQWLLDKGWEIYEHDGHYCCYLDPIKFVKKDLYTVLRQAVERSERNDNVYQG